MLFTPPIANGVGPQVANLVPTSLAIPASSHACKPSPNDKYTASTPYLSRELYPVAALRFTLVWLPILSLAAICICISWQCPRLPENMAVSIAVRNRLSQRTSSTVG
jgi:hypothetical protein